MRLNSEFLPKMAKPIRLLSIRHPPFDFADPNRGSCPEADRAVVYASHEPRLHEAEEPFLEPDRAVYADPG